MSPKRSKIGLDFRSAGSLQKSGVENYIQQLAEGLPASAESMIFYLFADRHTSYKVLKKYRKPNAKIIWLPTKSEKLFMRLLPLLEKLLSIDLFHFPISMIPRGHKRPSIITVYDLTYERYPEFYSEYEVDLQKSQVRKSAQTADAVIAISETTKTDLIKLYGTNPDKIFVTYLPVKKTLRSTGDTSNPQGYPYILFVGNIQPRKNLLRAIEAFATLVSKYPDLRLIVAGRKQDEAEYSNLTKLIDALGIQDKVKITGYIAEQKLSALYDHAQLLLFPSLYEGYGFPIVEAFQHDLPVITSDLSSMAEVAGDAAVLVDPESPKSITDGMSRVLADTTLKKALIAKGRKRLAELESEPLATATVRVYRKVLDKR